MTEDEKQRASSPESAPTYEPPRLVLIGNLRDLVGKSGEELDGGPPEPDKP